MQDGQDIPVPSRNSGRPPGPLPEMPRMACPEVVPFMTINDEKRRTTTIRGEVRGDRR
jgi:hypothetical protein